MIISHSFPLDVFHMRCLNLSVLFAFSTESYSWRYVPVLGTLRSVNINFDRI